ncbi:hypothetical protein HPP92_018105 [Vanilla planifolia]|uniref:Uncharacterized protein n=1 Tax=Vanilla planifolia TaxID=51239 RepID=A0A835UN18_VANPL|nr:hypothetical protein HPP92_018105 [Vanilla planifolia]
MGHCMCGVLLVDFKGRATPSMTPHRLSLSTSHRLSSSRDVSYSCGSCGYSLNLSSLQRNTDNIGSKYRKQIKKGVVTFCSIDESRFSQTDEVSCVPYFKSTLSWGLFRNRTKLQCRKCGNRIGSSYEEGLSSPSLQSVNSESSSSNGSGNSKKYMIKISKLQPSDDSGTALIVR